MPSFYLFVGTRKGYQREETSRMSSFARSFTSCWAVRYYATSYLSEAVTFTAGAANQH